MRLHKAWLITTASILVFWGGFAVAPEIHGALLYKSYVVRKDKGEDILCDPYVVQRNDWLLKIFKQRGEISQKDFPRFLQIFKRINPQVPDINKLLPGQRILIPLKRLIRDDMPGQSTGVVTLPFVTISDDMDIWSQYSRKYTVKRGDYISRLISKSYGKYGSKAYQEGIQLFKMLNPNISDLNRIYTGQKLLLPDPLIRKQPWYASLFDRSGKIKAGSMLKDDKQSDAVTEGIAAPQDKTKTPTSPFSKAATALDAKLLTRGKYYFPRRGEQDLEIDLSVNTLLQLPEGARILISKGKPIEKEDLNLIKSFWKHLEVIPVAKDASEEQVLDKIFSVVGKNPEKNRLSFSDHGLEVEVRARWIIKKPYTSAEKSQHICIMLIGGKDEPTPVSISNYLKTKGILIKDIGLGKNLLRWNTLVSGKKEMNKDVTAVNPSNQKSFVKTLLTALGFHFAQNVSITFPYAGIQVRAVSNLISLQNGNVLLVDFENFYGDAIQAIKKAGLDIIQVNAEDDYTVIVQKLLPAIDLAYSTHPTFFAAKRSAYNNIALNIPGFLITTRGASKVLLTAVPLKMQIVRLLSDQGIKTVKIGL